MIEENFLFYLFSGLKNAFPKHQNTIQDLLDMLPAQSVPNMVTVEHNCSIDPLLKCPPVLSSSSYQGHSYVQLLPFIQKLGNNESQLKFGLHVNNYALYIDSYFSSTTRP